jgi:hypothetical protein
MPALPVFPVEMGSHKRFLPGLARNQDPPDLSLPWMTDSTAGTGLKQGMWVLTYFYQARAVFQAAQVHLLCRMTSSAAWSPHLYIHLRQQPQHPRGGLGVWLLCRAAGKQEALSSNPSTTKKKKRQRFFLW